MLPSIIWGGFSVSHGNAMTRTTTLVGLLGQGGGGETERNDGQPESSGPGLTGVA